MGKVFRIGATHCHVIGVVEDGKYFELNETPRPFLFTSAPLGEAGGGTLLIETTPGVNTMLDTEKPNDRGLRRKCMQHIHGLHGEGHQAIREKRRFGIPSFFIL